MRDRKLMVLWFIILAFMGLSQLCAQFNESQAFTILDEGKNYIEVEFNMPEYLTEIINVEGKEFTRFNHFDAGISLQKGYPELLNFSAMFAIRNTGSYRVEKLDAHTETIDNILVYPAQGVQDSEKIPKFQYNAAYYEEHQTKAYQPLQELTLGYPAVLRDIRTVNLTVSPMQYNVKTGDLEIARKIRFRIFRYSETGTNEISVSRKKSEAFEKIYSSLILNYNYVRNQERNEYQKKSLVIVCPNNNTLLPEVETYADWKRNKGFHVEIAATGINGLSNSTTSIKNYLLGLYQNSQYPPEYIMLIGDATGSISTAAQGYGDHYYTCLEGTDILPEAFVGRISINNVSQFALYMSKMNQYERDMSLNTNSFDKSLLVGDTSPSGLSCVITCKYAKDLILERHPTHTFTEIYDGNPDNLLMNNAIDAGTLFFIYRGWAGMSGWGSSDISNLTNTNKLVNAVINTCSSGTFTTSTSNTEYLTRSGTPSSPKGAITAIGLATTHTHTQMNNCLTNGTMHGLYKDNLSTMGEAIMRGKLTLYNTYNNISSADTEDFTEWNNLIGDPSLYVWREPTKTMSYSVISNQGIVSTYDSSMQVVVNDADGDPLADAWVTVRSNENYYSVYTGEDGTGEILFDEPLDESLNVVVTKPDYETVLSSISVAEESVMKPYDIVVHDDNTSDTYGNNDGIINPGERVRIDLTLKNFSSTAAINPVVSLNSDDTCVYIVDSEDNFATIFINGIVTGDNGFLMYFSEDIDESRDVVCNLVIEDDNSNSWNNELRLPVVVPTVDLTGITIGDGTIPQQIQPESNYTIKINLLNSGTAIQGVYGRLVSEYHGVMVTDDMGYWGTIESMQTVNNTEDEFDIEVLPAAAYESEINFTLKLFNNSGYNEIKKFTIPVASNTGLNLSTGPDEYGYIALDQGDVSYQYSPTYNWIEIDPSRPGSLSGINTQLVDNGNHDPVNGVNNQIKHFDLPFTFKMYGIEYSRIGICSHGWITFSNTGDHETEQVMFRNYPIPDACGPSPMVAAFWDDIYIGNGAGVYYYYDNSNNTYIVEWSNCKNLQGAAEETFQVILYDPAFYPTPTGDGNIKVQYKVFNNIDDYFSLDYDPTMGNYCTIGLESHDEVVGLEYTYNNEYDLSSSQLANNTAIMFTTVLRNAPEKYAQITDYFVMEDVSGNNTLDAGETIDLVLNITNSGLVSIDDLDISVSCSNASVSLNDNNIADQEIDCNNVIQPQISFTTGMGMTTGEKIELELEFSCDGTDSYKDFITLEIGQAVSSYSILSGQVSFSNNNNLNAEHVVLKGGKYGICKLEGTSFSFYVAPGTYDLKGECPDFADYIIEDITVTNGNEAGNLMVNFDFMWRPEAISGEVDGADAVMEWNSVGVNRNDFIHYRIYKWDHVSGFRLYDTTEDSVWSEEVEIGVQEQYYVTAFYLNGESASSEIVDILRTSTDILDEEVIVYTDILEQNQPNPFNPDTKINYSLKAGKYTEVKVYNIKGELVKTLVSEFKDAGEHSVVWNGNNNHGNQVGSGVYFIRIKSGSFNNTIKAVLLK